MQIPALIVLGALLILVTALESSSDAQSIRVPFKSVAGKAERLETKEPGKKQPVCWYLPTRHNCMILGNGGDVNKNVNAFFETSDQLSFFNQVKSIYNGASNSATVSADFASLNFPLGFQVLSGTNIQAGASSPTTVTPGTVPTLSASSAGQATQNMLYGGTIYASGLYPIIAIGADGIDRAGGLGISADLVGSQGVDLQNFKSGTSTSVTNPPSHTSVRMEGYLHYNSSNLLPGTSIPQGGVFVGGSYGYSYTSHGYARDYGFADNVNNGIGQVSAGILINGVAKLAISRGFGPSQTFINATSMALTKVNNFKAWSFGISYQSPSPSK